VALGVAAGQALDYSSQLARLAVALPPILLGATLATLSIARWRRNERAMRLGEPLRLDGPYRLLTAGVVLIATIALAVLIAEAV
jgi:uncharacterized membrane protein YidH (DUF202 family)